MWVAILIDSLLGLVCALAAGYFFFEGEYGVGCIWLVALVSVLKCLRLDIKSVRFHREIRKPIRTHQEENNCEDAQ